MNCIGHFIVSIVKSLFRIGACVGTIVTGNLYILAIGLGIAEILGIVEEIVDKRK